MKNYKRFNSFTEAVAAYEKEVKKIDSWCTDRYFEVTDWLDQEAKNPANDSLKELEEKKKQRFIDFILEESKNDDKWYMLCSVLGANSVVCYSSREVAEKETDDHCGDMKDWALHTLIHNGKIICSGWDWENT